MPKEALYKRRWSTVLLAVVLLINTPCYAMMQPSPQSLTQADNPPDPLLDETPDPASDTNLGGVGCSIAIGTVSMGMLYLMGGLGTAFGSIVIPVPPRLVLEGSAAMTFVLSSACYVGVVLAPVVVSAYSAISEQLVQTPSRPLFFPGELFAIGEGTPQQPISTQQPPSVIPQQQPITGGNVHFQ